MNIGNFRPLPLCTLIESFRTYLYIVSFVVSLSKWVCDNWVYRFPTKIEPKLFFLNLFGRFREIPAKSRDIPPKKFDSLGFEGTFGPPPLHVEDPHPTRKYPDSKV